MFIYCNYGLTTFSVTTITITTITNSITFDINAVVSIPTSYCYKYIYSQHLRFSHLCIVLLVNLIFSFLFLVYGFAFGINFG